jgi:predicted  nucleic acid-binding Zn-ribbon protein
MNQRFNDLTEQKRGVENDNRDLLHKIDTLNFEIERLKHEIRDAKDAYKGLD